MIPNIKKGNTLINLKDNITDDLVDFEETADYINKFFTNIGPNLAKNYSIYSPANCKVLCLES